MTEYEPKKLHFSIQWCAQRLSYKTTLLSPRATLVAACMSPHLAKNASFFFFPIHQVFCHWEHNTEPNILIEFVRNGVCFINYTTLQILRLVLSVMETNTEGQVQVGNTLLFSTQSSHSCESQSKPRAACVFSLACIK